MMILNGSHDWHNDICGCANDCEICYTSCFCPCIQYGRNVSKLDNTSSQNSCLIYSIFCFFGCQWIPAHSTRGSIRDRYQIEGDVIEDCICHLLCTPLALAQEAQELKSQGQVSQRTFMPINMVAPMTNTVIMQQPIMQHTIVQQPLSPVRMYPSQQSNMMQPTLPGMVFQQQPINNQLYGSSSPGRMMPMGNGNQAGMMMQPQGIQGVGYGYQNNTQYNNGGVTIAKT